MSQCEHHICANSTFSWWGAYLSTDPCPIVPWLTGAFPPAFRIGHPDGWREIEIAPVGGAKRSSVSPRRATSARSLGAGAPAIASQVSSASNSVLPAEAAAARRPRSVATARTRSAKSGSVSDRDELEPLPEQHRVGQLAFRADDGDPLAEARKEAAAPGRHPVVERSQQHVGGGEKGAEPLGGKQRPA